MEARKFKDTIYSEFSRIGKVLSSPKRLELLDLLSQAPKSVELLANETKMSVANTSKHLQALLDARLVVFSKKKNFVIYQLANPKVLNLLYAIKGIAEEQIAEVNILRDEFIGRSNQIETIGLEDWIKRKNEEDHLLIDVRPKAEYQSGHLDDAMSIPISELNDYLKRLPKDKEIIAYCRGPYCVYATEAVELLKEKGYTAIRLEAGINEWKLMQENQIH
ncbi:ArsR/SmtB family transcription factor [Pseudalkalibacillus caeni]|uniref:Metalloregulator ArsR/SmtB family transcription factor n=1 Tax=Exobacillus caeni TaxID=2574798 RepID=A0A5R9EZL5_9BACL|nr:metalloregulator ArsR/SmtB family transcription factor [Pseudalkalibacillus caeni]TLS36241.1 metalloregulator ArsR/SmtB family transcription factor [Pseudalkalibacillus caeni]